MKDQIFNAFNQIHAEEALIEKTLEGMYSYREKRSRRAFFSQRGMALAVSFALMLCIGVTGWHTYFAQSFALTVDVNPSIEMTVNHIDRVISAKGLNPEGCEVLEAVSVKHMNYADAVDALLEEEKASGYLEEDGLALVAVACPDKEKAAKAIEHIDTTQADTPQTVVVIEPKKVAVDEAEKHDMSFGKYQAYLDLQEVAPEVTVEEVKEMSVQEIATKMDVAISAQTGTANTAADSTTSTESQNTSTNAGTNTNTGTNSGTNQNAGTNANTGATPNAGTNANTGATPNDSNKPATGTPDKKPVTNNNTNGNTNGNGNSNTNGNANSSTDKAPADGAGKDNASDKKPADEVVQDKEPATEPSDVPETQVETETEPATDVTPTAELTEN